MVDEVDRMVAARDSVAGLIRDSAYPLKGAPEDFDPLMARIGDAHFVLIGEASHGTHEFYQTRAEITKRLIVDAGFTAVAAEADWPDAYKINRYVRAVGDGGSPQEALSGFKRFPSWMWRNTVMLDFVEWLRSYNDSLGPGDFKAGFYGLDLYSLYSSIEAVIGYLEKVDPEAAKRARYRYGCFEHFGEDPQTYGYAASFDLGEQCEREVVEQLVDLQNQAFQYTQQGGLAAEDEYFFAQQNALVAKNAEEYYRSMFHGQAASWNLRDTHMVETLDGLARHFERQGKPAKIVVWEHNSHLGDARATEMSERGELNVGQMVRQKHGLDAVLCGFTTHTGTVTAASDWGAVTERKQVRPGLPGSYEALFHSVDLPAFMLIMDDVPGPLRDLLHQPYLERAIGVIYLPETERISHYFDARLSEQFDAVLHIDETRALEPLDRTSEWEGSEPPETYPTGE